MPNHYSQGYLRSLFSSLSKRLLTLLVFFFWGLSSLQAQPACPTFPNNIAYVNGAAPEEATHDGTSWATAFLTLEDALVAARSCGVTQIWVAQGTYQPTAHPVDATSLSSVDFTFHLVNGVALYGGFSGLGFETQLSERNVRLNPTILDGGGTTKHVVLSINNDSTTVVDGFTITGGKVVAVTLPWKKM